MPAYASKFISIVGIQVRWFQDADRRNIANTFPHSISLQHGIWPEW
jgi:hypothetical protein